MEEQIRSYGIKQNQDYGQTDQSLHLEEIRLTGFTIIPMMLSQRDIEIAREKIDKIYEVQSVNFDQCRLSEINEEDIARGCLLYDLWFATLCFNPRLLSIVKKILGERFLLNQQNAIINRPMKEHHQSAWHRDLPYQNFASTKPLAVSALICVDDFTAENGATLMLPHSHTWENFPTSSYARKHSFQACAPAGSAIVFDAMLFHRAGSNQSNGVRRGVNHVFTTPLFKQQISFQNAVLPAEYTLDQMRILGMDTQIFTSAEEFRNSRFKRMSDSK